MKVSAISVISPGEHDSRRNMFIQLSNTFVSIPKVENPIEKPHKLGIENLEEFTIFSKDVVNGKTIITA